MSTSLLVFTKLAEKPRFCEFPIAPHGSKRQVERLRDLFIRVAPEIPEFDHLGRPRVDPLQGRKRVIEPKYIHPFVVRAHLDSINIECILSAASPLRIPQSGIIHKDAAHLLAGEGKEVTPILQRERLELGKAKIRFTDQCRRLQHVVAALPPHFTRSNPAQLLVHQGCSPLSGVPISTLHSV